MLQKIKKIKRIEKRDRYDITVCGTHNFYANGILIHNSQINAYVQMSPTNYGFGAPGKIEHKWVATKKYNKEGLCLIESETNFYWRVTRAIGLWDMIEREYGPSAPSLRGTVVQVFGEALPCQALKYGLTEHTMRIFDIRVDGESVPYDKVPDCFKEFWVPVLFDGPFSDDIKKLCKGMEQVSGTEANIKEGMVVRPYIDRRAADGTRLSVKVINKKYCETGEEFD